MLQCHQHNAGKHRQKSFQQKLKEVFFSPPSLCSQLLLSVFSYLSSCSYTQVASSQRVCEPFLRSKPSSGTPALSHRGAALSLETSSASAWTCIKALVIPSYSGWMMMQILQVCISHLRNRWHYSALFFFPLSFWLLVFFSLFFFFFSPFKPQGHVVQLSWGWWEEQSSSS